MFAIKDLLPSSPCAGDALPVTSCAGHTFEQNLLPQAPATFDVLDMCSEDVWMNVALF